MTTNFYFNNFNSSMEKQLVEDLLVESIKMYGNDVYYLPRTIKNKDELYGADTVSEYNTQYMIEMYIKSVDGFEGDGVFLSKFGLEMRDQITLSVAIKAFNDEVGQYEGLTRPRESDLIWFTLNPNRPQLYSIKYVNDRSIFYQLGGMQVYDIICELFEYSGEKLNTGIADIDALQTKYSLDMSIYNILTQDGFVIVDQDGYDIIQGQYSINTQTNNAAFSDNEFLETQGDGFIDFTDIDPFSEGNV